MKWLYKYCRPIEGLMVAWTLLAFAVTPFWQDGWAMVTMVTLLLGAVILGWYLDPYFDKWQKEAEARDSGSSDPGTGGGKD